MFRVALRRLLRSWKDEMTTGRPKVCCSTQHHVSGRGMWPAGLCMCICITARCNEECGAQVGGIARAGPMEVPPRQLIWAEGHASLAWLARRLAGSQVCLGPQSPQRMVIGPGRCCHCAGRTGGFEILRAVLGYQQTRNAAEKSAMYVVGSGGPGGSSDFVWFQGVNQRACWLVVALVYVASDKS